MPKKQSSENCIRNQELIQAGYDIAMQRIKKILTNETICHHLSITLLASKLPLMRGAPDQILEPDEWIKLQGGTIADGMHPFYVYHLPSRTFTTIGASNIHHACNKATKEFQGEWSGITRSQPGFNWKFKDVKNFNQILKRGTEVPF